MGAIGCVSVILCFLLLSEGKISEYQLESEILSRCELLRADGTAQQRKHIPQCSEDGRFRHVQCTQESEECWCVDAEGSEIPRSRQNGSAVHCLTSCQLQRQRALLRGDVPFVPLCLESGEYQPIQCLPKQGLCWCVDQEGMEIYGTRQNGRPSRCPGSCLIRERRLLHGVGETSPPQCSADGNFLPVQCKFVNTTDMTVLDLLHTFNRLPGAFQTFSGFREAFPEVSSYCFCADSRGRELASTGVELLLNEVYDTAFSGMEPGRSFSKSNMYRILQRRFLGIQLTMSGQFRCPTKCERERSSSTEARNVFVPSCDESGSYTSVQCQAGGQCWCVDSDGREIFGTRLHGEIPVCSGGVTDCPSERRQALSRLFVGPSSPFSSRNIFLQRQQDNLSPLSPCSTEVQELLAKSGVLLSMSESGRSDFGKVLAEVIEGMFPSGAMALKAISLTTNPKRLQENLFGGKFLKNAGNFNFTSAVGPRGTLSFSRIFSQVGLAEASGDLAQLAKVFSPEASSGFGATALDQEVLDPLNRLVNLKKNRDLVKLVGATLESEQFLATLREVITVMKAEDSEDLGGVFLSVIQSSQPGVCQRDSSTLYIPQCTETGQYQQIQCQGPDCWCVDSRGMEVLGTRSTMRRPRCPSQCESEREMAVKVRAGLSAGSEVFIPKCEEDGNFAPLQCSGKDCFCVDREGGKHQAVMGPDGLQCPSDCQASAAGRFLSAVRSVLSDPSGMIQLSDVYVPQCELNGEWRQVQCDGPPEQAFQFYRDWVQLNNAGQDLPVFELVNILKGYGKNPEALSSFEGFVKVLFDAGHQKVFSVLSQFETFDNVPAEVLAGSSDAFFGPTVFHNPLLLWKILRGSLTQYPGQLSDFSGPLGHVNLRQCWCVGARGDMIANTKTAVNQVPKCPGSCSLVERQVFQFRQDAEAIISLSNISSVPLGYSFTLAEGLSLTPQELLHKAPVDSLILDTLLSHSDSALRLAAHSTLHFYWQSHLSISESDKEALLIGYQPYSPQCDSNGLWLPTQCYPSTGHCWCVDGEGRYIPGSLRGRSLELPECGTPCQRARSQALLSDWMMATSVLSDSAFIPTCEESGEFSVLQIESGDSRFGLYVSPFSGKAMQRIALSPSGKSQYAGHCLKLRQQVIDRKVGIGYVPECSAVGLDLVPKQCDHGDCWCVSPNGQEIPGTRISRSSGQAPACDSPHCPLPFNEPNAAFGDLVCSNITENDQQRQLCQLMCRLGYESALPVKNFLCDSLTGKWVSETPLPHACQRLQVLQTVQATSELRAFVSKNSCSSIRDSLQLSLLQEMRGQGLCSLQMTSPRGELSVTPVCDDSSVLLECDSEEMLKVKLAWRASLTDIPVQALPDLHDVDEAFTAGKLLERTVDLIRSHQSIISLQGPTDPAVVVTFGCAPGYRHATGKVGCVPCPAGAFFIDGGCTPCPQGSYQDRKGQEFCVQCPRGTSTASPGAFRSTHCTSDCQRSGLSCTPSGEFQANHWDAQMEKWLCLNSEGKRLLWTSSVEPLSEAACKVMEKFEDIPRSELLLGNDDTILLGSRISTDPLEIQLRKCISDCAVNESCHHVALFADGGQTHCEVYSTDGANFEWTASEKTSGFLGNPGADMYRSLSYQLRVKGDRPDLVVLRKKGFEFTTTSSPKTFERTKFRKAGSGVYRTVIFEAQGATLTEVHRFCRDTCGKESCCDGFILNQNILSGGTIMCGLLSFPDVLLCNDEDWDIAGTSKSNRICGAGVQYNKQKKQFTFNFGGQNFNITDSALPASSKNKTDYQATIIGFQRVYLWKGSDLTTRQRSSPECSSVSAQPAQKVLISDIVKEGFTALDSTSFRVNPSQSAPSQEYWIFKHQSTAQEAQLWCLKRCEEEEFCHVADVRDESPAYFTCALYPNTQACGAYDTPLRNPCSLVLPQQPQQAFSKKVTLLGSVESFYSRVPFKKMVSYAVRSRVNLGSKPITEGFFECERRCDEDPCCRGIGYVRDSQSPGTDVLCLTLNSFGIQTCGEGDQTEWRAMDCTPSKVLTGVFPFGWYEKPVNQWTSSPDLCPPFSLPTPIQNVRLSDWALLDTFSILVDPSITTFDVIHISKDIAEDFEKARDWCLSACEKKDSCSVVTVDKRDSAVRCVLYPDTHACVPTAPGQRCHLFVRESASHVYRRKGLKSDLTSVIIPDHGTLVGESKVIRVDSEKKEVSHFLGVAYARPPIGDLRFSPPQSAEWSGTWNATVPRSSCLQPGDGDSSLSSEDCLYLNVFVPSSNRGDSPVLVFMHNPTRPALLDGSLLAAANNIIVVTAHFRTTVFGFLSTVTAASPGNAGLQDQVAVLKWVQQNIARFGGDPRRVTLGAERSGADVASLHLLSDGATGLFHRALLMGGSAFSPASVISNSRARDLTESLAREVGCSSTDPAQVVSCLRGLPATSLNSAQTKLLAVSGPLQAWAPVVDGISVKEKPALALQRTQFRHVDIILGSSAEDGLISRAKNIKRFEELQGRADGKTAFYEALTNSLGGDSANSFVKEAATWFYSMQHSPTPAGYSVFSRALENATRDFFIVCPAVQMARFWAAQPRSNVFMYHLPDKMAQSSADLSMPLDLQYVIGLPHHTSTRSLFTSRERLLSKQMMAYVANFVKSGNPNHLHFLSQTSFGETLPPWPRFLPTAEGDNYKELDVPLSNRKGLKRAECSFWSDYAPQLTASTAKLSSGFSKEETDGFGTPTQETKLVNAFQTSVTQSKEKSGKDAYS